MSLLKSVKTSFRAYRMDTAGSSMSYYADNHFTLIEARYNESNKESIAEELLYCNLQTIDTLHITSWDDDHCAPSELKEVLINLQPKRIEYPGYDPETDSGKESLAIIKNYKDMLNKTASIVAYTPNYINSLNLASNFGYTNIVYHPKSLKYDKSNDLSTIKLFRKGSFNLLSLGDVESTNINAYLRRQSSIQKEVDIVILAHHGADNGFTNRAFLQTVNPKIAIATSNRGNEYTHPKPSIRNLCNQLNIPVLTTKDGDIIIRSTQAHNQRYEVTNIQGSQSIKTTFSSKKYKQLSNQNIDTIKSTKSRLNMARLRRL